MSSSVQYETYLNRLKEGRLYLEQGLGDWALDLFTDVLQGLDESEMSDAEKDDVRAQAESELTKLGVVSEQPVEPPGLERDESIDKAFEPPHCFQYGTALMDGQFWEEAIKELSRSAEIGYSPLECWELCGDCASNLEKWEEASQFYRKVYTDGSISEDLKRQILIKITRCSQNVKRIEAASSLAARSEAAKAKSGIVAPEAPKPSAPRELATATVESLDRPVVHQLIGGRVTSWKPEGGKCLSTVERTYRVLNLLHLGVSSLVVELEDEESGERFAGQGLAPPFNRLVTPDALAAWTRSHMMVYSDRVVKVFDLAYHEDDFFIVREHLPISLAELISIGEIMPIPLAINLAHQVLEGLGDLHLHMGLDEQIRNIYHLDLRPSRVLLWDERPVLKMYNGGLWKVLCEGGPEETSIYKLPLPFLPYRAPEQFRPYLARRRHPIFTDIYLFGVLFYEMLTGIPPFRSSSHEEYEIQHCEQYPTPPKVWRPEIPDEVNSIIMKCLETDPFKRWRSTTEISLLMEKCFYDAVKPVRDDSFVEYLRR